MKNLDKIAEDLFNKVRSRFSDVKLGDEAGALTDVASSARFFDVSFKTEGEELGRINIKLDDDNLVVIFNNSIVEGYADSVKKEWFSFLKEMRQFAMSNLLKFDTRDITKSNLEKRDYQHLAQKSGDPKMSESKLFGTSKTSYQDMGEAKIIVKHSAPVNYDNPAGRTQRIESIYIESSVGERFRYPSKHLNGARAMALHVANGGNPYDGIGNHISGLSEELSKLRQFKNYTHRNGVMAEALGDLTERVSDRIDAIKHQVASLQKQSNYDSFKESFQPSEDQEVPEDVMNGWVDALTIKTFNEELTSVFPYIYKLVSEKRADEIRYDDLVAEESEDDDIESTDDSDIEEHSLFSEFETQMDEVSALDHEKTDEGTTSEIDMMYNDWMNSEYAPYKDMAGDDNAVMQKAAEYLAGQVPAHELSDYAEALANAFHGGGMESAEQTAEQPQSGSISQEVVEFIQSMYDSQTGTFPRGEEGVKIAVEKKFGEQAGRFANFVVEKLSAKNQPAMQEEPLAPQAEPQNAELTRIKDLSGVKEAGGGFAEGDKVIYMGKHNATVVGQDGADYFIKIDGQPGSMKVIGSQLAAPGAKPAAAPSPFKRGDTVMWNGEQVTYIRPVDGSPGQSYITQASGSDEIVNDKELTKESFEALDIIKSLAGM